MPRNNPAKLLVFYFDTDYMRVCLNLSNFFQRPDHSTGKIRCPRNSTYTPQPGVENYRNLNTLSAAKIHKIKLQQTGLRCRFCPYHLGATMQKAGHHGESQRMSCRKDENSFFPAGDSSRVWDWRHCSSGQHLSSIFALPTPRILRESRPHPPFRRFV